MSWLFVLLAAVFLCWRPLTGRGSYVDDLADAWRVEYGDAFVDNILPGRGRGRRK